MLRLTWIAALCAACGGGRDPDAPLDAPVDTGPLHVFGEDRLHRIAIVVEPQYLETLEQDRDERVPCELTYDGTTVTDVEIRKKGSASSASLDDKTGFSLKFDDDQRLDGLRKLALNNAVEDPTFLSETIGYLAYREAGLPAPLTAHAVLTFNGVDKGLFIVKEPIAYDFLFRNFGDGNTDGNVYEGTAHAEDATLGDFARHPEALDLKDEASEDRERDDVIALAHVIQTATDDAFDSAVAAHFDLDAYVTAFALDTMLGFWDSYSYFANNYYLYHHPTTNRLVLLPHGMDELLYRPPGDIFSLLPQRLVAIPALRAIVDARSAALHATWPPPAILSRIDQVEAILDTASGGPQTAADLDSFRAELDGVRAHVRGL